MSLVRNNNSPDGRTVSGWAEIHAQRRAEAESNGGASGAGVYSDMADSDVQRLVKAARDYFNGYCQDEADDDGPDFTGCSEEQHLAAVALRDALEPFKRGEVG